jgi:DNA-binding NtrC family response regulator
VIVVSSEATDGAYAARAARLGIVEWVEKPVDAKRLMSLIEEVVAPRSAQSG